MTTPTLQRPSPFIENLSSPVHSWRQVLADLGKYFTATNATPGTGVNHVVSAAYSATVSAFTLRNGGAVGAPQIYLDYIRLVVTQAPASATSAQFATFLDSTLRGSAGTVLSGNCASLNQETNQATTSVADLRYTPTTAAAGANAYQHGRGAIRSVIPVVNDEFLFVFGAADAPGSVGIAGTTAIRTVIPCAPVILGAATNQTFLLHLWFPGNATTPAAFEFEVGWAER